MKTKSPQESAPSAKPLPPLPENESGLLDWLSGAASVKGLARLKRFAETVLASGEDFMEFAKSLTLKELVAKKFCPAVEDDAPAWAKQAARMVFASLFPERRKQMASETYNIGFEIGHTDAAAELISSELRDEYGSLLLETTEKFHDRLKVRAALEMTPGMAADFFKGVADGYNRLIRTPERARQMAQRTKIYKTIVERWTEVAPGTLKSTGELHQWLIDQKVIVSVTDSRETRHVCDSITLRYSCAGGRPKNVRR